ncbi:type II secretion system F family protein [Halorhodospira abdelmalekii]|uniref:type II secretion system F family protein n=1 Tax=Halorhodospira abdelmalekii TaxID=421629 RepID=UPI0019077D67
MKRLRWHGVDKDGRRLSGVCDAETSALLGYALRAQGIEPVTIHRTLRPPRRTPPTPSRAAQASLLRRLATLLDAGAPLERALRSSASQESNGLLRDGLRRARRAVEHGRSLGHAFAHALPELTATHRALLSAGERSGDFVAALRAVAEEIERSDETLRRLRRAAAYPAVIVIAAAALLALLLLFIVPRFAALFAHAEGELPGPTRLVMATAELLATTLPLWCALASFLAILPWCYRRLSPGRRRACSVVWSRAASHLPGIGTLLFDAALSRWSGTLARLLSAGIPLLEALPLANNATGSHHSSNKLAQLTKRLHNGERFAAAFHALLPTARTTAQLIAVGEEAGRLDEMLAHAARYHHERLTERLDRLSALIEPTLIVLVGGLTALIVVALYLPVFQLGATL